MIDPLAGVRRVPLWLDTPARPAPRPAQDVDLVVDLAIVGGGFTGLWAALLAAEADPDRRIAIFEAGTIGGAASGRNGGFCSSSLTHGLANGLERWPDEMPLLLKLGAQTLDAIEQAVQRYGIDCGFRRGGDLIVAVAGWQLPELARLHQAALGLGQSSELLDAGQTRALAGSMTYRCALLDRTGTAVVDPARLIWGLAAAAERLGVTIHENTKVTSVRDAGDQVRLSTRTAAGDFVGLSRQVLLGTNAFPSPLRRLRPFTVPVWDHVLATEPLSDEQWDDLGWSGDYGISDAGNRFHYYRTTQDRRIVWGGYDALYYYGSDLNPRRAIRPKTERRLAEHFFATFPQLAGLRFTHAWAGTIDTSTRFTAFWGQDLGGKAVSVQGYTGLGVGASRFGAQVALDLLEHRVTERTELAMVRERPTRFPPEPVRWAGITVTRWSLARADFNDGYRNLWLRTLDRLGLGFDS